MYIHDYTIDEFEEFAADCLDGAVKATPEQFLEAIYEGAAMPRAPVKRFLQELENYDGDEVPRSDQKLYLTRNLWQAWFDSMQEE